MTSSTFIGLINNSALLMALAVIYDIVVLRQPGQKASINQIPIGATLGLIGIAIMMNPWEFLPGVIFDTRSILLSITGLFFGTVPTLVTASMTGGYRLYLGGAGSWTGFAVILTSGLVGLAWRHWIKKDLNKVSGADLYLMGVATHILMLLWMLTLPRSMAIGVLSKISLPVILIFPLGTLLLGKLIINRLKRIIAVQAVEESETRYRGIVEDTPGMICRFLPDSEITYVNKASCEYFGKTSEDLVGKSFLAFIPEDDHKEVLDNISTLTVDSPSQSHEHQVIIPDGRIRWHRWTNRGLFDEKGDIVSCQSVGEDISDRKLVESEREITLSLLQALHKENDFQSLIQDVLTLMHNWSNCEAVGIRLKEGDDYPYFETRGFPQYFVEAESHLCALDENGEILRDSTGNAVLECMCGNIIHGRFDLALPFFSENGSFWTNSTTELLASTTEEDRQARTRNRCNGEGYESVALVPLKDSGQDIGLLQFNDFKKGQFDEKKIALFERLASSLAMGLSQRITALALKESEKHLSIRNQISHIFLTIQNDKMYAEVLNVVLNAIESPYGTFAYIDQNGDRIVPSMTRDIWDECKMPDKVVIFPRETWVDTIWGKCLVEKKSYTSNGPFNIPDGHIKVKRALATPIVHKGESIGNFMVGDKPTEYTEQDIALLEEIADFVAPLLASRLLNERYAEEKEASKNELKKESDFLQRAQEIGKIGTWELDIPNNILTWTDENYRIFGVPIGTDLSYETFLDCVHPDDREYVDTKWEAAFTGKPYDIEHRLLVNGKVKWVREKANLEFNENGKCVRGTGVTQDITGPKQSEVDQDRLLTAIEQSTETIVITDTDGNIQYTNPGFETVTGYSKEETIGQNPRILKSGKQNQAFYRNLWQTIKNGDTWHGKLTNIKKDGTLFVENASISPVKDRTGEIVNFVAVKRDITNEIRMEERLQQAQKMEAIGTLAGGIAHDFNNVLFPISGYTEMLLEDAPEGSFQRHSLTNITKATKRATDLVNQILTFSRQSKEEIKPLEMQHIVKEVLKLLRASLPTTIDISQDISDDCAFVMANSTQIHQIVMNLVTNAYHAMEEAGGELEITLKEVELGIDDPIDSPVNPGSYVCLTVSDKGKGMNQSIIDRIFDPYFTTKAEGKGTGLGLAVTYGIVKGYGGDIRVYSEPGKGTVFHVYIPCIKDAPVSSGIVSDETLPSGRERILLVDDENQIILMEKQMLERLGYHVTTRTSSIEAREAFREQPDKFDLVITDMTMPNMTGDKLAEELLEIRPDIPIVLCTGFSEKISKKKADAIGFKGFLMKPIVMKNLAKAIREALDGEENN
jgi:PAS domain S-box-containing protein